MPMEYKPPAYTTEPPWEHTYGPQVASLCRQVGYEPDPEQERILDALFAVSTDDPDLSAAYETGVIAPRQNLKTGLGKMAALGWMFVTREEVVSWSAHEFRTARESFKDLAVLIENSQMLLKRMPLGKSRGIHGARGAEIIETKDHRELRFFARTKTGTRGLTGDKIVLDEAFALREDHMGSVGPTLTAVPDPQMLYLSSAGMLESDVLRDLRDRGRSPGADRLAYFEWCSRQKVCQVEFEGRWIDNPNCLHPKPGTPYWKPGCALDDEELWAEANTLLGRKRANGTGLTIEKLRTFRRSEPPSEWRRERMGWWDDPGTLDVFGPGNWGACERPRPEGLPLLTVGIAVSIDLSRASLVGATGTRGEPVITVLQNGPGTDWVIPRLEELRDRWAPQFVIDADGPSGSLFRDIELHDKQHNVDPINPVCIKLHQALDACSDIYKAVSERRLSHEGDAELDEAVRNAVQREVRDRWLWGRKKSTSDVSPLEAATFAVWALSEEPFVSAYESGQVATV